jgi:competence protein ComEA
MKRFTSTLALVAFVAALAAPLALAQGSTDAAKPAASATPATPATPASAKKGHAMRHKAAGKTMAAKKEMTDINTAAKEDLTKLPGITDEVADKIIAGRPYKSKFALVKNKTLTPAEYAKVKGMIIAKQAKAEEATTK